MITACALSPTFSLTPPEHEMPYIHTFIMQRDAALAQVLHFIEYGKFDHSAEM